MNRSFYDLAFGVDPGGARLTLDVYQQGKQTASIDLHPFVTISVKGYPDITFTGPEEPVGYDFEADDDAEDEDATLSGRMFDHHARYGYQDFEI
ncbi:hypothetical protein SRB5_45600 [Streptomyces sp. RB5]|uniref:Uncharacterized protein n=1 Tax=Streptomyces smaragdinus TaxID=2585196 RepID=A0A7K0CNR1_9ACTN|nr:hypothetical protein [Streptomyces smaragdinus]MQY14394.1 hypothetical protein [Streptomyces smaragdinus]